MDNFNKSKVGGMVFILFIILLIIGGQYLYNMVTNKDNDTSNNGKKVDYRIDIKKDYFYFENESVISESAEIFYKDIVINIKGQETLTESLNKENAVYKSNIKYISDANLLSEEMVNYNNDNLYMLTYREYQMYSYDFYKSLVILDYMYDCFDQSTIHNEKSYMFDTNTGKLLSEEEILSTFDTSLDKVKDEVREYLNSKQEVVNEVELIKIDETINDFNYGLFVNDVGRLNVTFLVKSTQTDYNDSIVIE